MSRAAFWLAGGATVAILFSIAASQILLGLALAALLLSGTKLRLPPIGLPLALFIAGNEKDVEAFAQYGVRDQYVLGSCPRRTVKFEKGTEPKYIELQIKDSTGKLQPEFEVKIWQ